MFHMFHCGTEFQKSIKSQFNVIRCVKLCLWASVNKTGICKVVIQGRPVIPLQVQFQAKKLARNNRSVHGALEHMIL